MDPKKTSIFGSIRIGDVDTLADFFGYQNWKFSKAEVEVFVEDGQKILPGLYPYAWFGG